MSKKEQLEQEKLALGFIHKMVSKDRNGNREITDEATRVIINENLRRWKHAYDSVTNTSVDRDITAMEETWKSFDEKFNKTYPHYDYNNTDKLVEAKWEKKNAEKAE